MLFLSLARATKRSVDHGAADWGCHGTTGCGLAPVTAEMRRLMADPAEIDRALAIGAERARETAQPVVDEVKKIVGFWRA